MKKLFSRLDKPLLITTIIFFIFGAIMIQSASSMESFMRYNYSPYHYFVRELIFLAIGTVFFLFTIIFPTKNYKKVYSFLLFLVFMALLGLLVYGHAANNAVSWYKIGPFTLQPSEFAKVIVIIYLAVYYEKNIKKLDNEWIFIKPIILVTIVASLVLIQPDMGTAFIIMVIAMLMFYAVPVNKKYRSIFNKIIINNYRW